MAALAPQPKPSRQFGLHLYLDKMNSGNRGHSEPDSGVPKKEINETAFRFNQMIAAHKKTIPNPSPRVRQATTHLRNSQSLQNEEKELETNTTMEIQNGEKSNNVSNPISSLNPPKNNIDDIYKIVKNMLEGNGFNSVEHFMTPVSRIFSQLANWELLSDKDITTACKALALLADSRIKGILASPTIVTQMINFLYSQDIPIDIQITVVRLFTNYLMSNPHHFKINAINSLLQHHNQMKKVVCDKIIHCLVTIALTACDEVKAKDFDPALMTLVINCLCAFAGKYNRRNYIPGETRDYEKVRSFFITQGKLL